MGDKIISMPSAKETKYDLDERTFKFAEAVVDFIGALPKTVANVEISKQLIRSAGSIGANYIEANESLGEKDFGMHLKICRKEAKETGYWLRLLKCGGNDGLGIKRDLLKQEALELTKIFSAIINKNV